MKFQFGYYIQYEKETVENAIRSHEKPYQTIKEALADVGEGEEEGTKFKIITIKTEVVHEGKV